jgi:lipoprotein-anchoring transpeptidase ErfK/SrfK
MKRMKIDLTATGEGTLECVGFKSFRCVGKKGMSYPKHIYVNPASRGAKENPHFSAKYSCAPYDDRFGRCVMKHSIQLIWQWGVYIHEWVPGASISTGGPSHGCIHLDTGNAEEVYNWVDQPVDVRFSYPWRATSRP